ncbi:hypothetical protein [Treponema sp.]|uniref:hypothetical protein n=1 Tax=Treponema sp. TaxID=166 RepID=UPI00298EA135|nr:hypothetical protein [Treponema sp.]
MKKKVIYAVIMAVLVPCLFTSCLTSMLINSVSEAAENAAFKKNVVNNYAEYNPSNSAIVYTCGLYDIELVQQNPKLGYKILRSIEDENKVSSYTCLPPVPVNSELAVLGYRYQGYRTIYIVEGSVQGVDYVITKPGLFYMGIKDFDNSMELEATKKILPLFTGTEWEPIIRARIEELKNEKKK